IVRLFPLAGRVFIQMTVMQRAGQFRLLVHELDALTLRPIGPMRRVVTEDIDSLTPNAMFFAYRGEVYLLSQVRPLTISLANFAGEGDITCRTAFRHRWDSWAYEDSYGEVQFAAPPIERNGRLYVVLRSLVQDGGPMREPLGVLVLDAAPPFA